MLACSCCTCVALENEWGILGTMKILNTNPICHQSGAFCIPTTYHCKNYNRGHLFTLHG